MELDEDTSGASTRSGGAPSALPAALAQVARAGATCSWTEADESALAGWMTSWAAGDLDGGGSYGDDVAGEGALLADAAAVLAARCELDGLLGRLAVHPYDVDAQQGLRRWIDEVYPQVVVPARRRLASGGPQRPGADERAAGTAGAAGAPGAVPAGAARAAALQAVGRAALSGPDPAPDSASSTAPDSASSTASAPSLLWQLEGRGR